MGRLDGKVAIVTGAARGLGRAYAKRLAGLGAKLAVADLNLRSYEEFETEAQDMTGETTVAEIEASGGTALGIEVDVRDNTAVEAMLARILREWGGLTWWACSSGLMEAGSSRNSGPIVIAFSTAGRSPISSSQRFTFGNSSMSIFRVAQLDARG